MSRRILIPVVAVLAVILGCLGGAVGPAAAAGRPQPTDQPACTLLFFDIDLGQGIEAFCAHAPGTYQVIAQCDDGAEIYSSPGSLAVADQGPSVAECRGFLLFPAHVLSYFIVQ